MNLVQHYENHSGLCLSWSEPRCDCYLFKNIPVVTPDEIVSNAYTAKPEKCTPNILCCDKCYEINTKIDIDNPQWGLVMCKDHILGE